MKVNMKAIAGACLLAASGGAQAAILQGYAPAGDGEMFISIYRDNATPESMIIDTNVSMFDLRDGVVTGWTSDASQTSAIQSFLASAPLSDFRFNAGAVTKLDDFLDTARAPDDAFYFSSNAAVSPTLLPVDPSGMNTVQSNISNFIVQINNAYSSTEVITGLNPGEPGFHQQTGLWADDVGSTLTSLTTEASVQDDLAFWRGYNADTNLFGYEIAYSQLGTLHIDTATGVASLSTGPVSAVPVPAAAWLLGSGVVGLVGVARRRKSA